MSTDPARSRSRARRKTGVAILTYVAVLALARLALGAYDLWAYQSGGQDATVTQVLRDVSAGWPFLPPTVALLTGFALATLIGHLYPTRPDVSVSVSVDSHPAAESPTPAVLPETPETTPRPPLFPGGPGPWEALPYPPVPGMWFVVRTDTAIWFSGPSGDGLAPGDDGGFLARATADRLNAPTPTPEPSSTP